MLNQKLQQKLIQKLSPQQILLMKLLQVPTIALEQRIKQEIEENPALEELAESDENQEMEQEELPENTPEDSAEDSESGEEPAEDESTEYDRESEEFSISDYIEDEEEIPSYKTSVNNYSPDDERKEIPYADSVSSQEMLLSQLGMKVLDERQHQIASYIIGNLDDSGYLQRDLEAMVDDLAFAQNITTDRDELLEILKIIQEFDPAGIGARNLQECLLLQLKRKPRTLPVELAIHILEKYFLEFTKKHYDKIIAKARISEADLKQAIGEILKLNPKPGNSMADSAKSSQYILPDFLIFNNEGELELSLNSRNTPELRLSKTYIDMLEAYAAKKGKNNAHDKDTLLFIKQKIDSAKWFIDAIRQRQNTLYITMKAIMDYQKDYFQEGDETKLRPMILKDIAEMVNLDISTISRVANSKYVQTPFGTFLLKSFFSESLPTDSGEEVSTKEIKKILSDCIEAEKKKKPLTDDQLTGILKEKGYNIARRTVAKYREQLNIPVARLRKEL